MNVKRCTAALLWSTAGFVGTMQAAEPLRVHTEGVSAKILYEAPISGGHLPELKGKYKLRITEISIASL